MDESIPGRSAAAADANTNAKGVHGDSVYLCLYKLWKILLEIILGIIYIYPFQLLFRLTGETVETGETLLK